MIITGTIAVKVAIALGLIGLTVVLFWHYIVAVFADHIIPFFRSKLGGKLGTAIADGLASLIGWLDGKVTLVRSTVSAVWQLFKQKVLGMKATYRKATATTASVETEAILDPDTTGKRKLRVSEREVPLSDLPDEVRQELERGATTVEVDLADTITRRVAEQAAKDNIPIEELDLRL